MKCPVCPDATLVMTDRNGVEIDYCPQCRGVWLDRGELDKLLERAAAPAAAQAGYTPDAGRPRHGHADFEDSDYNRHSAPGQHPQKRKKSWLNEIFD